MNFEALNWLINSILNWHKCDNCWNKAKKEDINIKNIENNSVNLEIICSKCGKNSFIKSEVMAVDLKKYLTKEQVEELKKAFIKEKNITDEEIVNLNKELKKENFSARDLFE